MLELFVRDARTAQARAGELVLLVGRSGGGKSLTLQRLAGLRDWPPGVHATWQGHPWPSQRPPPVFFAADLWPPMWLGRTLGEELGFGLREKPPRAELEAVLNNWGLARKLAQPTERLARHEAVRTLCAAAELGARRKNILLVLLDQSLDALAFPLARAFAEKLAHLAASTGTIVILATAHPRLFVRFAARIWRANPCAPRELVRLRLGSRA